MDLNKLVREDITDVVGAEDVCIKAESCAQQRQKPLVLRGFSPHIF
jgi:hypothetical protein